MSYPENIKNNIEEINHSDIKYIRPFMAFTNEQVLSKRLVQVFKVQFNIPAAKVKKACELGWKELLAAKADMQKEGEKVIEELKQNGGHGIVLAGRPYHTDPEVNHGIPELIASYGHRCPDRGFHLPSDESGAPADRQ